MKIHKNDTIKIMVGKEKGKTGKVVRAYPEKNKILIDGLNLYRKRVKPKRQGEKGEIIMVPRSINISNAMLICPSCKNPVKVGYSISDGVKKRVCKKCHSIIE